eukprot:scaffold3454_cov122-Isochrysis_galbana.AAC.5
MKKNKDPPEARKILNNIPFTEEIKQLQTLLTLHQIVNSVYACAVFTISLQRAEDARRRPARPYDGLDGGRIPAAASTDGCCNSVRPLVHVLWRAHRRREARGPA